MKQIVIIGAGISGLAAAALLGRQGHTVTLLEKKKPREDGRVPGKNRGSGSTQALPGI